MVLEPAADHLCKRRPVEKRVIARVRADEALALIMNEGEQVLFLLRRQVVSGAEEEDGLEIVQVVRVARRRGDWLPGDPLRVCADIHLVRARFAAQAFHNGQGVRDRIVLVPGESIGPGQHTWRRLGTQRRQQNAGEDEGSEHLSTIARRGAPCGRRDWVNAPRACAAEPACEAAAHSVRRAGSAPCAPVREWKTASPESGREIRGCASPGSADRRNPK